MLSPQGEEDGFRKNAIPFLNNALETLPDEMTGVVWFCRLAISNVLLAEAATRNSTVLERLSEFLEQTTGRSWRHIIYHSVQIGTIDTGVDTKCRIKDL